jgi:hypothetical protein
MKQGMRSQMQLNIKAMEIGVTRVTRQLRKREKQKERLRRTIWNLQLDTLIKRKNYYSLDQK